MRIQASGLTVWATAFGVAWAGSIAWMRSGFGWLVRGMGRMLEQTTANEAQFNDKRAACRDGMGGLASSTCPKVV